MGFKMKGPSMHKGTKKHTGALKDKYYEELNVNRQMDQTSLPDGRPGSSLASSPNKIAPIVAMAGKALAKKAAAKVGAAVANKVSGAMSKKKKEDSPAEYNSPAKYHAKGHTPAKDSKEGASEGMRAGKLKAERTENPKAKRKEKEGVNMAGIKEKDSKGPKPDKKPKTPDFHKKLGDKTYIGDYEPRKEKKTKLGKTIRKVADAVRGGTEAVKERRHKKQEKRFDKWARRTHLKSTKEEGREKRKDQRVEKRGKRNLRDIKSVRNKKEIHQGKKNYKKWSDLEKHDDDRG